MNIQYITVARTETAKGKILSVEACIDGKIVVVSNPVDDYNSITKEKLAASFRTLADLVEAA